MNHPILQNHSTHRIGSISEQLLAEVVHKIKNSLGGISGFATLLERDLEPEDPRSRLVKRIEDGVLKLNDFVVFLMILVRIDEPVKEEIRLIGLIRQVWENYMIEQEPLFNQNSLQGPSSDKIVKWEGDPLLVRHMIHHAIRFIHLSGGELIGFELDETPADMQIHFNFRIAHPFKLYDDIFELLQECPSVETKLSLAIVVKMADHYSGAVKILDCEDDRQTMQIHLRKGD